MQIGSILKTINKRYRFHNFSGLSFNSKKCKSGNIFFAIKGSKDNGNNFINDAIKKGAKTIISNKKYQGYKNDVLYLKNNNPRKLLSKFANKIYKKKPNNIIAVTGTNGKSSITNFFFQILTLCKKKVTSIGTLGVNSLNHNFSSSKTTLDSITLNKILEEQKKKKINNVILEASSHGLKQHRLDGIDFKIGIFTNFSRDHLDYHKSYKDYFKSKMILFNKLMKKKSIMIYDSNEKLSHILKSISKKNKLRSIAIGRKKCDLNISQHKFIGRKQEVLFNFNNHNYSFKTDLIGEVQIKNLLMAVIAASKIISMKKIVESLNKIKSVNGRLEPIGNLRNNSTVILDYAHSPESLKTCLKNIKNQFKLSEVSLVFGCGGERDKPKRQMMGKIANDLCDKIYLTDDNPRKENPKKIRTQIKKNINKFKLFEIPSREKAIVKAINDLASGNVLVVAGKGHENYQEYFTKKIFSDKKCILKNIKLKNKFLNKDWKVNIIREKFKNTKLKNIKKINKASINSKEIKKNDIFFGITGKRLNGNKFADDAIKKKAALAIIEKNYGKKNIKKIKVENTLKFLSEFSYLIRKTSNIQAVAITGSTGKTSLKELLGQSLNKINPTSYSNRSYNNKYGVPLSLFNINNKNFFGIFEVGMDKKGEIDSLTKIIKPNLGVITNVSYAHIKNFKNLNHIANAKSEIINNILSGGSIILNKDDHYFNFFKNKALKKNLKIISFSKKINADIRYIKTIKSKSKYLLFLSVNKKIIKLILKENILSYLDNILATVAVISYLVGLKKIKKNLFYNFNPPSGRGDIKKIKLKNKKINLIDESYNSNPLSLKFAINNFDKMNIISKNKKILLGDMLELGKFSKKLHKDVIKNINQSKINKVFVYGKYIDKAFNKIKTQKKGRVLKSKKEILNFLKNDLNNNDYLMVKGSNATGLNMIFSKIKKGNFNVV